MEYHYQPAKFEATTEKQESYKQWDLPNRPARVPAPMRATLPFTGMLAHASHIAYPSFVAACKSVIALISSGSCPTARHVRLPPCTPLFPFTGMLAFGSHITHPSFVAACKIVVARISSGTCKIRPVRHPGPGCGWQMILLLWVFEGETTSRETFKGCQLPAARGTLGIAVVGDALHKLIPASKAAPCSVKEVSFLLIVTRRDEIPWRENDDACDVTPLPAKTTISCQRAEGPDVFRARRYLNITDAPARVPL